MIGNVEKSGLSPSLLHFFLIEMVNDESLPPVRQNLPLLLSLCLLLCSLLTVLLDLTKKRRRRENMLCDSSKCVNQHKVSNRFSCVHLRAYVITDPLLDAAILLSHVC